MPWRYLPSGLQYDVPENDPGKVDDDWIDQAWPPQLGRQRHLLQLRYVDGLVGALLDRLRATDTLDDTVLVVTADHGISFQPGLPVRGLETDGYVEAIHPDVMWVPLFVKRPGEAGGRTLDTNVETVDVVPTIADVLGVEMGWKPDGRSVFGDDPAWHDQDVLPEQGERLRRGRRAPHRGGCGRRVAGAARAVPSTSSSVPGRPATGTVPACATGWSGPAPSWSTRRWPTWRSARPPGRPPRSIGPVSWPR